MKTMIMGIEVFIEDADQYLQIDDISGTDLHMIWEQIETDYAAYEKWVCYHNYVDIPLGLLDKLGATLEDDCIEMRLDMDKLNDTENTETHTVEQITEETFDEFAAIHDARNTGIHWTGARLKRELPRWGIFCLRHNEQITDYTIMSMRHPTEAEIFCVEASDKIKSEALIASAAKHAFENEKSEVLYQSDNDMIHQAALSVSFAITGFYKGYRFPDKAHGSTGV